VTIAGVRLAPRPDFLFMLVGVVWTARRDVADSSIGYGPSDHAVAPGVVALGHIGQPPAGWVVGAVLGTALVWWLSVLAHNLGHVAVARSLGIRATAMPLRLCGDVTRWEEGETAPARAQAVFAAAGPLVSAVLALGALAALAACGWSISPLPEHHSNLALVAEYVLRACLVLNVLVLLMSLLPLRVLDGGKLLLAAGAVRR
jgi:Zn-dependent protease